MAKKEIRLTFYYADESIWTYVKRSKVRERLVKWANEFYDRYNFKINERPFSYNEKLYKKTFSLAKSDGIKADYTAKKKLNEQIDDNESAMDTIHLKLFDLNLSDAERQSLNDEWRRLMDDTLEAIKKLSNSEEFELEFRKLIFKVDSDLKKRKKVSKTKERLPVVFCDFVENVNLDKGTVTTGQTFALKMPAGSFFSWGMLAVQMASIGYQGPLILLDAKELTKKLDYVLAHEIVHAAGNTTLDNQGAAKNIMIYADAEGKAPKDVNLEETDQKKLEAAFFVV